MSGKIKNHTEIEKIQKSVDIIENSNLFDSNYYLDQLNGTTSNSILHFVTFGDAAGLNPTPYFDTRFYKIRYENWSAKGSITAFEDFILRSEAGEILQPHPLIDPIFYGEKYEDLLEFDQNLALHFMRFGDLENRQPSIGFNSDFYRTCYLPLSKRKPFYHYITKGESYNHLPLPIYQTRAQSYNMLAQNINSFKRPLIILVNDAQRAGVPILALQFGREAKANNWDPIFILKRAGPKLRNFSELGLTIVISEGWNEIGLASALSNNAKIIAFSVETADFANTIASNGPKVTLLVHESAKYIFNEGFKETLINFRSLGGHIIASFSQIADELGCFLDNVEVVQPGIVLPTIHCLSARSVVKQTSELDAVFIGAGRGGFRKGFDRFLSIAVKISSHKKNSGFIWLGELDEWSLDLVQKARRKGLKLITPGFVEDYSAWYRRADAYLLTSRYDPGPATAIHAVLLGTPVVAYDDDIGIKTLAAGFIEFINTNNEEAFVTKALNSINISQANRRARRLLARDQITNMSDYFKKIIQRSI